ncbi:MAG: hypothetical protein FWD06_05235 [Oscillospiraceae bacterium]|nr:hypothetical protein [Oscillospiraceae bacterium]
MLQSIIAIVMAIVSLFSNWGHMIMPWSRPTNVVTDPAQVLAIYRNIANANQNLDLRRVMNVTEYPAIVPANLRQIIDMALLVDGDNSTGLPGNPAAITPADLASARAETHNNGRTLVVTLVPRAQVDGITGASNEGSVGRTIGVLGAQVTDILNVIFNGIPVLGPVIGALGTAAVQVRYENPRVQLRVDAQTLEIVSADFSYDMAIVVPLVEFFTSDFRIAATYRRTTNLA